MQSRARGTLAERFWRKVDQNGPVPKHRPELGPCWLWTAALTNGYGVIGLGGRADGIEKAPRVAFFLETGSWPEHALHHCDNAACVKARADERGPAHIYDGDNAQNIADRVARNRTVAPRGQRNGRAMLMDTEYAMMRRLHAQGWGYRRLAARFGISRGAVRYQVTGKGGYADQVARRARRTK